MLCADSSARPTCNDIILYDIICRVIAKEFRLIPQQQLDTVLFAIKKLAVNQPIKTPSLAQFSK